MDLTQEGAVNTARYWKACQRTKINFHSIFPGRSVQFPALDFLLFPSAHHQSPPPSGQTGDNFFIGRYPTHPAAFDAAGGNGFCQPGKHIKVAINLSMAFRLQDGIKSPGNTLGAASEFNQWFDHLHNFNPWRDHRFKLAPTHTRYCEVNEYLPVARENFPQRSFLDPVLRLLGPDYHRVHASARNS